MRMRKSGRWAPNLDCERPAAWRGSSRVDRRRQPLRRLLRGSSREAILSCGQLCGANGKKPILSLRARPCAALADNGRVLGEVRGRPGSHTLWKSAVIHNNSFLNGALSAVARGAPRCNTRNASVGISRRVSNWESTFPHEADVDHRGARRGLACARRALSAGPILSRSPR